jgi:hypothetical protein
MFPMDRARCSPSSGHVAAKTKVDIEVWDGRTPFAAKAIRVA